MKLPLIASVITLSAAIILRLIEIPERFIFDLDAQYLSLFGWTLMEDFHVLLIGVSASNTGYYLGPGLTYLTGLLLFLTNGDPISLAYFASGVGIMTLVSITYIAYNLFSKKAALIAAICYGFSAFTLYYDRKYWPILIPLVALWLYYSLVQVRRGKEQWLLLTALLIGASYHIHLTLWLFWPFILWTIWQARKRICRRTLLVSMGIYAMATATLLVFDTIHGFDNLLMPYRMLLGGGGDGGINVIRSADYLGNLIAQLLGIGESNSYLKGSLVVVLMLTVILLARRIKKDENALRYLLGVIALFVIAVLCYPGPLQTYYGVFILPFLILLGSRILSQLNPVVIALILIPFVVLNISTFIKTDTSRGLAAKKAFIQEVTPELAGRSYALTFPTRLDYEGWRYLFQVYGKIPARSDTDTQFGWLYQDDISTDQPELTLLITESPTIDQPYKTQITHGVYHGYIIENTTP